MRRIGRFCSRVVEWFCAPGSAVPLGWFRIAMALFCLLKMWIIRQSFFDLYGQYGFVQWAITRANLYDGLPHIGNFAAWLSATGITADQTVYLFLAIYVTALIGLLLGIFSRFMAIVAWCVNFLWMHAGGGLIYGMDIFTHIGLFYAVIMPVGNWISVDRWRRPDREVVSTSAGLTRRILQVHLSIIYVSSGIEKAAGLQWWNGEAIWRSVMLPAFRQFDMTWLAWWPWLSVFAGWSVMVLEIGYGLIWWRKTRALWLGAIILLHLSIGLFLGMWLFGLIMVLLSCAAFGYETLDDLRARFPAIRVSAFGYGFSSGSQ